MQRFAIDSLNDNTINSAATMRLGGGSLLGRIDQYELVRELGGGGFGTVYLAKDTVAGIEVAVKGLPPIIRNNADELERIRENFALVSRLHHPYIAAALHLQLAREVRYVSEDVRQKLRVMPGDTLMVMEYAPGVTLSKWRKQFPGGRVPLEQALQIVWQIAQALDFAHEQHILHRDVKPSNIIVETKPDGEVIARLLDFGLAAEIRSSMGRVSREIRDTSGTRPYMAPEQWEGRKQGPATDQYTLAVLLCELLTGEVPFASVFETGDPVVMMTAICNREVELPEGCPRQAALCRALAKDPSQRFSSCMEFVESAAKSDYVARSSRDEVIDTTHAKAKITAVNSKNMIKWGCAFLLFIALVVGGIFCRAKYCERIREAAEEEHWATISAIDAFEADPPRWEEGIRLARMTALTNVVVQFYMGSCYENGYAVTRDNVVAAKWYRKAAEHGYAAAQVGLGNMYRYGFGGTKDEVEAVNWYRKAAEQGCADAQTLLGLMYECGMGVNKDTAEAVKWYHKAAEQGDASAQNNLGMCYAEGEGVIKDTLEAVKWYREAANQGDFEAQYNLGKCYAKGEGVTQDEMEAVKWYRMAAKQGHVDAQIAILELEKDRKKKAEEVKRSIEVETKSRRTVVKDTAERKVHETELRKSTGEIAVKKTIGAELQKYSEEQERKRTEAELVEGRMRVQRILSSLSPKVEWKQLIQKLNNVSDEYASTTSIVCSAVSAVECMRDAEAFMLQNARGMYLGAPYYGVVKEYEADTGVILVESKIGKGNVIREYEQTELLANGVMFDMLYVGVVTKASGLDPLTKSKLILGAALLAKYFPCGARLREQRVGKMVAAAVKNCPASKEFIKLVFPDSVMQNSAAIGSRDITLSPRESYARKIIDGFSFNITNHFLIGPSLRNKLQSITVTDKEWDEAKLYKAKGDYLNVLSALSGRKIVEYPEEKAVDEIFRTVRRRELHILLEFHGKCDYVKCFRIHEEPTIGAFKKVTAEYEGSTDKIDDSHLIVIVQIGDDKSYMVTSSCYYDIKGLSHGDYNNRRRDMEKKLEYGLLSRSEFDRNNMQMNQKLTEAMIHMARTR